MDITHGISAAARELVNAIERTTDGYVKSAKQMQVTYGATGRGERARRQRQLQAETETLKRTTDAFSQLADTIKMAEAQQRLNGRVTAEVTDAMSDLADELSSKLGNVGHDVAAAAQILGSGQTLAATHFDHLNGEVEQLTAQQSELYAAQAQLMERTDGVGRGFDGLRDKVGMATNAFFSHTAAMANITAGFARSFTELEFAMQHQSDLYMWLSGNITDSAMSLGLAPIEMQKIIAKFRPLLSSASEFTNLAEVVHATTEMLETEYNGRDTLLRSAYRLTGSFDGAANLILANMQMLQGMGTRFSTNELGEQTALILKTMGTFAEVTGVSSQQQTELIQQYIMSGEVQQELMQLDKKRRAGRLQEILLSLQYQTAQRGSIEAALSAQNALTALSGMSTRDRMREAAVVQQIAGALGLALDPNIGNIIRKSPNQRTAPEAQSYLKDMDTLGRAYFDAQQSGNNATRVMVETLFSKLSDTTRQAALNNNTILTEGLKPPKDMFEQVENKPNDRLWLFDVLAYMKEQYDATIGAAVKDPSTQIAAGVAGEIGADVKGIYNILRNEFGTGGTGIGDVASWIGGSVVAGTIIKAVTGVSVAAVGFTAALTAGAAALAAFGVYEGTNAIMGNDTAVYKAGGNSSIESWFQEKFDEMDVGGTEAAVNEIMINTTKENMQLQEKKQNEQIDQLTRIGDNLVVVTKAIDEQTEINIELAEAAAGVVNRQTRKQNIKKARGGRRTK